MTFPLLKATCLVLNETHRREPAKDFNMSQQSFQQKQEATRYLSPLGWYGTHKLKYSCGFDTPTAHAVGFLTEISVRPVWPAFLLKLNLRLRA